MIPIEVVNGDIILFTKRDHKYELLPNQDSYQNKNYILVKGGVIIRDKDNWQFIHEKDSKYDIETWSMEYWALSSKSLRSALNSDVITLLQTNDGYVAVCKSRKTDETYVIHHQIYDPTNINAVQPSKDVQVKTGYTRGGMFGKRYKIAAWITTALLERFDIIEENGRYRVDYRMTNYEKYWEMTELERSKLIRETRMQKWRAYLDNPRREDWPATTPIITKYSLAPLGSKEKILIATIPGAPDDYLELYTVQHDTAYPLQVVGKERISENIYLYVRNGIRVRIHNKRFKWPVLNNELVSLALQDL